MGGPTYHVAKFFPKTAWKLKKLDLECILTTSVYISVTNWAIWPNPPIDNSADYDSSGSLTQFKTIATHPLWMAQAKVCIQ